MDFLPLSPPKQVHGIEPGHTKDEMPNLPVILATIKSVAAGPVSPKGALLSIRRWLNLGELQVVTTELTHQEQFA